MSLQYPLRHVYITQPWGVNPHIYSRFNFLGHNGVDMRLFDEQGNRATTAILYAPHDGKVIEARNDANGYGLYLKIENSKQGSILGHLESFSVKVGDTVKQGQRIGICDNTGWSTGAHLHWGYYRLPRNRQNGYGGTIDQMKLDIKNHTDSGGQQNMISIEKKVFEELVTKSTERDQYAKQFTSPAQAQQLVDQLKADVKSAQQARKEQEQRAESYKRDMQDQVAKLAKMLDSRQDFAEILAVVEGMISKIDELEAYQDKHQESSRQWAETELKLQTEINRLKMLLEDKDVLANAELADLIKEMIRRFKLLFLEGRKI